MSQLDDEVTVVVTNKPDSELYAVFEESNFDVNVGESAALQVNEGIQYIQSGKKEIGEAVAEVQAEIIALATQKTAEFDENAEQKTNNFNDNATDKTQTFNTNATGKTNAYNQNASSLTANFNNNANAQTITFNQNASDKTTAFNTNYAEKKALIDAEVQTAETAATNASNSADLAKQWAVGIPSEPTGYSAKHWAEEAASELSSINAKIPAEASASNQLADKAYVDAEDNSLQSQIDALVVASDVYDIVGTYAELQAYDISTVPVNDIIKVLVDSTHSNAATYYRCVETGGVKSWSYIGSEGAYYTKAETNTLLNAKQDTLVSGTNIKTVNGNSLLGSGDVNISAVASWGNITGTLSDQTDLQNALNAKANSASLATVATSGSYNDLTNKPTIPTKTSELTNDSNFATVSQIPTDYVDLATNQNIGGDKNFLDTVTAGKYRGNFEPGYGGFEYASAYSTETIKYGRLASILINGTFQTNEVQFMVQQTNKLPSLTFGEIKTRVHNTAGTVNLNDTDLTYTFMPKEMIDTGILNGLRLYYWNNFDTNQAKVEIWIENPAWTTTTFSIIDTISTGNGRSRAWTFYHNDMHDDFPSDATGYKQARLNVLSIGKPTEDTTSSIQADTVGARNTKLASYATTSAMNSVISTSPYLVLYGTSSSAADATAKIVEISSSYATTPTISAGQLLIVKPTITSTVADSTITVQKSSTTLLAAKTMKYNNANITTSTDSIVWTANVCSIFVYDGSYWQFLGHGLDNNTTYPAMSVAEGIAGTATNNRAMRADYLKQILDNRIQLVSSLPATPESNILYCIPES